MVVSIGHMQKKKRVVGLSKTKLVKGRDIHVHLGIVHQKEARAALQDKMTDDTRKNLLMLMEADRERLNANMSTIRRALWECKQKRMDARWLGTSNLAENSKKISGLIKLHICRYINDEKITCPIPRVARAQWGRKADEGGRKNYCQRCVYSREIEYFNARDMVTVPRVIKGMKIVRDRLTAQIKPFQVMMAKEE